MEEFKYYHNIIEKSAFVNIDKPEVQFEQTLKRMFKEFENKIISGIKKEEQKVSKSLGDINFDNILKSAVNGIKSFILRLSSIAMGAAQKGLERSYKDIGAGLSWNIDMTPLADYYKNKYKLWFSEIIEKDLQLFIMDEIQYGVKAGLSVEDLSERISRILQNPITVPAKKDEDGNIIRKEYQIDKDVYSTMVARTEVSAAVNNGRLYGYQESGLVKTVEWHTNPGACELCEPHSREVYDVGDAMNLLPYHPNCRCTFLVKDYKEYPQEETNPDMFSNAEKIVTDPNGVGIADFFKVSKEQQEQVEKLMNKERYNEAINLLRKYAKGEK